MTLRMFNADLMTTVSDLYKAMSQTNGIVGTLK